MKSHERPTTKKCKVCRLELPITEFYEKKRKNSIGHFAHCKKCESIKHKARYEANKTVVLERQKKRRVNKKAEIAEWHREHYLRNKDEILAKQRQYNSKPEVKARERERLKKRYAENREEIRRKQLIHCLKPEIREQVKDRSKRHYQQNKVMYLVRGAARRASKRQASPIWADNKKIKLLYSKAARLTDETGVKYVVDHVIPLVNDKVCGLHVHNNLQVITQLDNLKKSNKFG